MNKHFQLAEYKIQASILLKSLKSLDDSLAAKAIKTVQRLPEFSTSSDIEIKSQVKRKHALNVIALEKGFYSWLDLKIQIYFIVGGFLNKWFAHYAEAKSHQKSEGGFLLPYKHQFFICDDDYMQQIGFDAIDPDWMKINYDWAKPSDQMAWQRLYKKWLREVGERDE